MRKILLPVKAVLDEPRPNLFAENNCLIPSIVGGRRQADFARIVSNHETNDFRKLWANVQNVSLFLGCEFQVTVRHYSRKMVRLIEDESQVTNRRFLF